MTLLSNYLFAVFTINYASTIPLPQANSAIDVNVNEVHDYLTKYGYLLEKREWKLNATTNSTNTTTPNDDKVDVSSVLPYQPIEIKTALREFQQFMGLTGTGTLDKNTYAMMKKPRCGEKDRIPRDILTFTSSVKLTNKGRNKVAVSSLSYFNNNAYSAARIFKWVFDDNFKPTRLSFDEARFAFQYALNRWAAVCNVLFEMVNSVGAADIVVSFRKGSHGDKEPFDGQGGVLAHASADNNQVHFDDDESFQIKLKHSQMFERPSSMPDFVHTAIHEVGHLLKLPHSSVKESVMYAPLSLGSTKQFMLHSSDVENARSRYGVCWSPRFDAIFSNTRNGKTYISVNYFMYEFNDIRKEVEQTWPRLTYQVYPAFQRVDEIVMDSERIYLFKGTEYSFEWSGSYSRRINIAAKFHPNLTYVDAAFTDEYGRIYFIKKDQIYRWNSTSKSPSGPISYPLGAMEIGWPKPLKDVFPGAPERPDTVFRWMADGRIYFFKGRVFYIWNTTTNKMESGYYNTKQWKNVCNSFICQTPGNCHHWDSP